MTTDHRAIVILPVNGMDAAQRFFARLGFRLTATTAATGSWPTDRAGICT